MTQNQSMHNKRYLMNCKQQINENSCQHQICESTIIDDFDISNYTEYVMSFFQMGFFLINGIIILYQIVKTVKFVKEEKVQTYKLRLIIQCVALLSPIWYIISLIYLNQYQGRIQQGSIKYSSEQNYQEDLIDKITLYVVFQTFSSSCYSLAFFLSFFVWFGVLSVTLEKKWIKFISYFFNLTSVGCFCFQIASLIVLIIENDAKLTHVSVSASVLLICVQILSVVFIIRKKIENLYEINQDFKNMMSRYIVWLAIACTCRPLFNLLLAVDVFDGIQCFKYFDYEKSHFQDSKIQILENTYNSKSIYYTIFIICNNISLIPLTILLSPRRRFRQNNQLPFAKSLQEDFVQSYQKDESISNIDADNKSSTNNA